MKHSLIFCLLILFCPSGFSQSFEARLGGAFTQLDDLQNQSGGDFLSYERSFDTHLGLGIRELRLFPTIPRLRLDINLNYDQYGGPLQTSSGGRSIRSSADVVVEGKSLGLAVYPLHLFLFKKGLHFAFGPELAFPFAKSFVGSRSYRIGSSSSTSAVRENNPAAFNQNRFSLNARVSLKTIRIQNLTIHLFYNLNRSLSAEFVQFTPRPFVRMHRFGLTIEIDPDK